MKRKVWVRKVWKLVQITHSGWWSLGVYSEHKRWIICPKEISYCPSAVFPTAFVKPNNPEEKELTLSLSVAGFLSSEYVIFLLSLSSSCPQETSVPRSTADSISTSWALKGQESYFYSLYFFYASHHLLYLSETFSRRRPPVFPFLKLSAPSVLNGGSDQSPCCSCLWNSWRPGSPITSLPEAISLRPIGLIPTSRVGFVFQRLFDYKLLDSDAFLTLGL